MSVTHCYKRVLRTCVYEPTIIDNGRLDSCDDRHEMVHGHVSNGRLEKYNLNVPRQVFGDGQDTGQDPVVSRRRLERRVFHQRVLGVGPDDGQVVPVLGRATEI